MPNRRYTKASSEAVLRYKKKNQKQISLSYKVNVFNEYIVPAIKKSGLGVATFFKIAVQEKIERDQLGEIPEEFKIKPVN